jgi:spore cortex biosynthesis protein YabQ
MILTDAAGQGFCFLAGVFCGMLSGVYFDTLKSVRRLLSAGKILTAVCDAVFGVLSTFTTIYFIYPVNGFDLKWYIVLGILLGFVAERFLCGKPVAYITEKVYNIWAGWYKALAKLKIRRRKETVLQEDDGAETL